MIAAFIVGGLLGSFLEARESTSRSGNILLVNVQPDGAWIFDVHVLPNEGGRELGHRRFMIEFDLERFRRGVGFASSVWVPMYERRDVWLRVSDERSHGAGTPGGRVRPGFELPDNAFSLLWRRTADRPHAQPIPGIAEDPELQLALAAAAQWADDPKFPFHIDGLAPLIAQGGGTEELARGWGLAIWVLILMCGALCSVVALVAMLVWEQRTRNSD